MNFEGDVERMGPRTSSEEEEERMERGYPRPNPAFQSLGERGKETSMAPWGDWGRGRLRPNDKRRSLAPEAENDHFQPENAGFRQPLAREPIFEGVSARAKSLVFQFVFELKIRAFVATQMLEQELRKHPEDRRFLKVWPDRCPPAMPVKRGCWSTLVRAVDGTMPGYDHWCDDIENGVLRFFFVFVGSVLRGAGQAMLANNLISGLFALVALGVTSLWLLVLSSLGLVSGTLFAMLLGVNSRAVRAGLFGYNALLLGGAVSVCLSGGPWNPLAVPLVLFGSSFTVVMTLALGNAWAALWGAPAFTFPFIIVTWIVIACMHSTTFFRPVAALAPVFASVLPTHIGPSAGDFFSSWMSGCGQIYIAGSPYSGLLVVLGMAFYSRISAFALMLGSMIGLCSAYMFGASSAAIAAGLWGYDPALLMIAMFGVFFVPSPKTLLLSVTGAFMSCFVCGALFTVLGPLGLPQLTFGFSFTALVFVLVQMSLSNVSAIPLWLVTTPESHLRKTRLVRQVLRRFEKKRRDRK